ncbi:MAG: hypothetical protein AAFY36_07470 [Bacteroidota bacterium]
MSDSSGQHLAGFTEALSNWAEGKTDFVNGLPPQLALQIPDQQMIPLLQKRIGEQSWKSSVWSAQQLENVQSEPSDPEHPKNLKPSSDWIRSTNMVGINVRTIGNFWQILKYQLCLPAHVQSIHLLPIWEPGVVSSLYGMASWRINTEFFSQGLYLLEAGLDTVEKQLIFVVDCLHKLGRLVGMDVIPHTDRYSEIVLANPSYFEWLHRDGMRIADHHAELYKKAEEAILIWLQFAGTADQTNAPLDPELFFRKLSEEEHLKALFGSDPQRRISLIDHLYRLGLEPVPATMAPPYRGLEVDPSPDAQTIDEAGRIWRDYRLTEPTEMSRVFGPLTRYQLYERKNDNRHWEIDFDRPRVHVWEYVACQYARVQSIYGFDFMRGDMSHVQMRPEGPSASPSPYYDLLAYVKTYIQKQAPNFAYFAESFLAPDDYMGYGNEVDHLIASKAEVALGNLQSTIPGSKEFLTELAHYQSIAQHTTLNPCFTVITSDKDDPRFDRFYTRSLAARMFTALLLTDWPSYYSLGVEQRDLKYYPWPNEYYTKLYVFYLEEGPKSRHGPYKWGGNSQLFHQLDRLHQFVSSNWSNIEGKPTKWLIPPNPSSGYALLVWHIGERYLCMVNFGEEAAGYQGVLSPYISGSWAMAHSLSGNSFSNLEVSHHGQISLPMIEGGEGVVWTRTKPPNRTE